MSRDDTTSVRAVSLFSGLGGLDIGAYLAGVDTIACVDQDDNAVQTLRTNSTRYDEASPRFGSAHFDWTVVQQDITNLDIETDLLAKVFLSSQKDSLNRSDIDLVIGGPPCQAFSRSNEGSRTGTNSELGQLYEAYVSVLADLKPAGFVFENVVGILSSNGGDDIDTISKALSAPTCQDSSDPLTAYNVQRLKLDASNFGVPQARERVFILGVREDLGEPPTRDAIGRVGHPSGWPSAGAALESFIVDAGVEYQNAINSRYAGFLKNIPPGANYQHFSDRRYENGEYVERSDSELVHKEWDWRSRHWNYLLKQDPERTAWTLQAQPGSVVGPFHWRSRRFTTLEQLRLMTIPVWYEVAGSSRDIQRQIGNAVPPYLACAVIAALTDAIGIERSPQEFEKPSQRSLAEFSSSGDISIADEGPPWDRATSLLYRLTRCQAIEVEAQREQIPELVGALELIQYWIPKIMISDIEVTTGDRPDPSQSRTYRQDTPAPSILSVELSREQSVVDFPSLSRTQPSGISD